MADHNLYREKGVECPQLGIEEYTSNQSYRSCYFCISLAIQVKTVKVSISSSDRRFYIQSLQTGSLVGT